MSDNNSAFTVLNLDNYFEREIKSYESSPLYQLRKQAYIPEEEAKKTQDNYNKLKDALDKDIDLFKPYIQNTLSKKPIGVISHQKTIKKNMLSVLCFGGLLFSYYLPSKLKLPFASGLIFVGMYSLLKSNKNEYETNTEFNDTEKTLFLYQTLINSSGYKKIGI